MYADQKKNALEYHVQKFWGMEKFGVFPKQKKRRLWLEGGPELEIEAGQGELLSLP